MEISLRGFFSDFNASKCIVYFCLLIFTLLFAAQLDHLIDIPYVIVFAPLFIWKALALSGAVVGCVSHCRQPAADAAMEIEYRTMVLCAIQHALLLVFEVLVCYKLSTENPEFQWLLVFAPLVFESIISIVVCIWSVRQERSIEFELFFSVNIAQFVLVALKLDRMITWSWAVIFIPLWILICVSLIAVLYAIILALLLIRSIDLMPDRRRQHMWSAVAYTLLVVPLLVFLVLLTGKLDGSPSTDPADRLPFVLVCTPLYVSLVCVLLMACGARGGNQWWFGMRTDFCAYVLSICPCLQQYGNVSYKFTASRDPDQPDGVTVENNNGIELQTSSLRPSTSKDAVKAKALHPIAHIDAPD